MLSLRNSLRNAASASELGQPSSWPRRAAQTAKQTHIGDRSPKKKKGAKPKLQQTLGIVMRSAFLEELKKVFHHNIISDCTLTLPHIQRCLEDMMQEMGISAADAPTSGVTAVPIRLWFTAP